MNRRDRIIGCIVGGAIGDAFAGPYEGLHHPIEIDHQLEWRISDDTQLTLATCEAISTHGGQVDPSIIASTFAQWYRNSQVTGLGASTYKALSELSAGGHWAVVGRGGEMAAGNGAAMRIAPLAFCLDPLKPVDRRIIRDVCRITHRNDEAYAGALAILFAIRSAYVGQWDGRTNLFRFVIPDLPDSSVRDRLIEFEALAATTPLEDAALRFGSSGYVVESVPLALLTAQRIRVVGFRDLMSAIARAGGDTDTIASMAGQVCGTLLGQNDLPEDMVKRLPNREKIISVAESFVEHVMRSVCKTD